MTDPAYLIVVAETDPVAVAVAHHWGTPPSTGDWVEGAAIRRLSDSALLLRRPGPPIRDERLDGRLPIALKAAGVTLVFPSIHRSTSGGGRGINGSGEDSKPGIGQFAWRFDNPEESDGSELAPALDEPGPSGELLDRLGRKEASQRLVDLATF